jgi:hypothetical protein
MLTGDAGSDTGNDSNRSVTSELPDDEWQLGERYNNGWLRE